MWISSVGGSGAENGLPPGVPGDVLAKLHARSRAEMVALARDAGLGRP